jgi:TP901 family phage tail tape measure protein
MPEQISQDLGFNASQALKTLADLDGALARLESRLSSTTGALAKFNQTAGTDKALQSFAKLGTVGPQAMQQLAQTGTRSATTLAQAWNNLISVHGRYSTSLALASRIIFTQAVVSGFRQVRTSIEDSVQSAINFQRQLAEIRSIDTDKIFGADLGDKLRNLSSSFNLALPDVASGAYEALSAQVLKTGSDFRFMTAAAQFSKGSLTSLEASVKGLAGALNAYGQGTQDVDRLASQFNETIRLGTIRGEELANQFGTVATLGKQLGVSQAELLATIAALTNAGVPQAQAFTQLRGVLTALVKPSEQLAKVFREQGIGSAEQLIAARGFGDALKFLREQTDGTTAGTAELFRNQRALLGVLSIGGQNAKTYADALKQIDGVSSSLNAQRAQEVMASDAEKLTAKWNKLKNDMIPVGDGLITIGNKAAEAGKAITDVLGVGLAKTITLFTDYEVRADKVADAQNNLAKLFGKDLTIGASGGRIVSEVEVLQRRLEVFERRRQDANKTLEQAEAQHQETINKLRFKEIDNAKAANKQLQTEAQSAADAILGIEKRKIVELSKTIEQSRQLIRESQSRLVDLRTKQDDQQFRAQTADLSGPQQALALMQRSQALASQAGLQLESAARSGNKFAIDRARALFDAAEATAQEAQSTARAAGARDRELQAGRALAEVTRQQIAAEESAARIAAQRLPTLEQQRVKQQASLDLVTKATQELIKNSSLFDKSGEQVSGEEAAKRAEARARALKTLVDQGIPKEKIIDLQFKTEGALQTLAQQLQAKLNAIDPTPFQTAEISIRGSVGAANEIASAYERAAAAAGRLNGAQPVNRAFGGPLFAASGALARGIDTVPAMLSPGEMVINAKQTGRFFSQLQAINAGQVPSFRSAGGNVNNVTVGDVVVQGSTSAPQTARTILRELKREVIRRGV